VVHGVLLLLLAWGLSTGAARKLELSVVPQQAEKEVVEEVTMIFPEQLIPAPGAKPPPKAYIRTTQNETAATAPKNAPFQSDRNTTAASRKAPAPDATLPLPSTDGIAFQTREMTDRDYRDGALKNDAALAAAAGATALQMLTPKPATPPSILKPQPAPPPPAPPPAEVVAKATPTAKPLAKMMEDMDKEAAKLDVNRLPLEVRKPPPQSAEQPAKPQVRVPEDAPPVVKALPVPDPVTKTTPNAEKDAFMPFTRTGQTKGTVATPGENAVDAEATPLGIYMRQVQGAVQKKWHQYVHLGKDAVTFGRVRFHFFVDRRGTPQDLKILSDARDADPRMRELTLRSILDAEIPPIPADLLPKLDDGRVKIEYEAIIY